MLYCISSLDIHRLLPMILLSGLVGCSTPDPKTTAPQKIKIEMTGHDFKWQSRYAGADQQLGTDDDLRAAQVIHVPINAEVEIFLKSRDYLYSLEIPQAGRKEIAVPDLTFSLNFTADKLGTYEMPGDQMCGYTHPDLMGTLVVESREAYDRWRRAQR